MRATPVIAAIAEAPSVMASVIAIFSKSFMDASGQLHES
jgi:hypothetical protein